MSTNAERCLKHGAEYPYDASDEWRESEDENPPAAADWAHAAARGVIADLSDRGAIDNALGHIDEETRVEIVQSLAAIIRVAAEKRAA
jgi:hypothetical protein